MTDDTHLPKTFKDSHENQPVDTTTCSDGCQDGQDAGAKYT